MHIFKEENTHQQTGLLKDYTNPEWRAYLIFFILFLCIFWGFFSLTYILLKIAYINEKIIGGYRKIKGKVKGQPEGNFFQQRILIYRTGFAWKEDGDTGLLLDATVHYTHPLTPLMPLMFLSHPWSSTGGECSDQQAWVSCPFNSRSHHSINKRPFWV